MQHDYEGNDYYFRDSFDHSSSESQLLDATGTPGSRNTLPSVPKMQRLQNSKIGTIQKGHSASTSALGPNSTSTLRHRHMGPSGSVSTTASAAASTLMRRRTIKVIKLFIPALMLTVTVLFIVTVVFFETDSRLLNSIRKTPEMLALKSQYYAPIKNFLKNKLGLFWLVSLEESIASSSKIA